MVKLVVPFLAVLFFFSCQDSKTPENNQEMPAELKIDHDEVVKAHKEAEVVLQNIMQLSDEINVSIPNLSEEKQAELDLLRTTINDVIAKQRMITKGLENAATGTAGESAESDMPDMPPPGVVQDYMGSLHNYDEVIVDTRKQYEALKSGN
ncbi:MAG: hypothetical protein R3A50_02540 [Saprospiraceae bacterium]|nr:hypothetical protein [Saprospiraceae bacterium]MCB9343935.1 hypothetical protein [Lewinellaceae bacterium]